MNLLQRHPAQAITLQLLVCLVLVVLPHTPHLSPWIWLCFGGLIAWRAAAAARHWSMPPGWLRLLLALLAFVGVYITYGRINGQQGGLALFVVLLGVKLTELSTFRDHVVVALLAYFVLISQFLFSQELIMVLWLIAGVWLITATLLSISHPQSPLPYRVSLKRSASLLLQAAPLMLLFFFLFPRIPGPLWGLPADGGAARSGLSDSMAPGDIGHLVTTDEIAFRVTFKGEAPPHFMMYWRGPVFEQFDGRTWGIAKLSHQYPDPNHPDISVVPQGERLDYEVTLEPHRRHWLFALDVPVHGPWDARIQREGVMLSKDKINERLLYKASSVLNYQLEPQLEKRSRLRNLYLPEFGNPRTRELANSWRRQGLADNQIVEKALTRYREQEYIYSLQPPTLGANPVDEFLFNTRRGFCEHFSGSFAYLMRAAGIPARIVTGYQGGEFNRLGGYYIFRQSDAHAWVEIWMQDQGWVRIDPTAAVSPERIELGLQAALPLGEEMAVALARRASEGLLNNIRLRWDWVNASWYRWVLGYGPELQATFLRRFGLRDWGSMILVLTVLASGFLGLLGLVLIWQLHRPAVDEPVQKLWLKFCQKMQRRGLARKPHEGPRDYAERLCKELPDEASAIKQLTQLYIRLRYGRAAGNENSLVTFKQVVSGFR